MASREVRTPFGSRRPECLGTRTVSQKGGEEVGKRAGTAAFTLIRKSLEGFETPKGHGLP